MSIANNILNSLVSAATRIRDEKQTGANTAYRVGSFLLALCQNMSSDVDDLSAYFLRKDKEDVAQELITFLKGLVSDLIQSSDFSQGELGSGFVLRNDKENGSYMEIDRLLVRRVAYFVELIIKSLKHVGGSIVLTPASMQVCKVDEYDAYYRCYFESERDGRPINQEFVVGDQARCQTFNINELHAANVSNKFYWRLVIGVGDDYIDLSKSDCAAGSMEPEVGEDIVQLGNRDDATRQNAIILSAYGDDAPSFKQYAGINSYSLSGKEVTVISRILNSFTGRFISKVTGEDFDTVLDRFKTDLSKIKAQSDQEYTIWFYNHIPTLENSPAVDWDDDDKADHEYDIFYYEEEGLAWRFLMQEDGSYAWIPITDQQTLAALEKAAKAQDTADCKRRNFVSQPVPPYDEGDTWSNAFYGALYTNDDLVCITAKAEGEEFSIDDWRPVSDMNSETKKTFESQIEQLDSRITLLVTAHDELAGTVSSLGVRIDAAESNIVLYGTRITDTETSIAALQVTTDEISSAVTSLEGDLDDAVARIQTVEGVAASAGDAKVYKQTTNPWLNWASGTEYKYVGAVWYCTADSTSSGKNFYSGHVYRYIGYDNTNSWEDVTDIQSTASYVLQNKEKISTVVASFDSDGNLTNTSGLVTTSYASSMYATKTTVNNLGDRVSTAEAEISVHSTQIALRVEKDGIISAINQSSESITIDASRINLNGYTNVNDTFSVDDDGNVIVSGILKGDFECVYPYEMNHLNYDGWWYICSSFNSVHSNSIYLAKGDNPDFEPYTNATTGLPVSCPPAYCHLPSNAYGAEFYVYNANNYAKVNLYGGTVLAGDNTVDPGTAVRCKCVGYGSETLGYIYEKVLTD